MNLAEHFAALEWTESTIDVEVKHPGVPPRVVPATWPCLVGTSADGKTTLQLIGSPDNIRGITLLGQMSADDLEATKRNGAYAAVCLAIIAPQWVGRDQWLATTMRNLRRTGEAMAQHGGWRIGMKFYPATNQFVFKAVQ